MQNLKMFFGCMFIALTTVSPSSAVSDILVKSHGVVKQCMMFTFNDYTLIRNGIPALKEVMAELSTKGQADHVTKFFDTYREMKNALGKEKNWLWWLDLSQKRVWVMATVLYKNL